MTHARTQIRDAFVTALTGLDTTGQNIFPSRVNKLKANQLPAICIYTKTEEVDRLSKGRPSKLYRSLKVNLDIYVKNREDFDDEVNAILAEIEIAIYSDDDLHALAKDIIIESVDEEFSGEGDKKVGVSNVIYKVEYITSEDDPETII